MNIRIELNNFVDYLCKLKLLNCEKRADLIDYYIMYYNEETAKKARKAQAEAETEAKFLQARVVPDYSYAENLYNEYQKNIANRSRNTDTRIPINDTREPISKEEMEKNLKTAQEIDKENNINFFRKQIEYTKNNLKTTISILQEKIRGTNLAINLQNNIYILSSNGNNDKIAEDLINFNNNLLKISEILSVEKTDFLPNLDYDTSILKLGEINLLIGDLNNQLSIIIKENNGQSGGKRTKYKSTGITVYILYKKKKYNRAVYVKDKGNTKYCKINNEYILLSKLKVI